MQLAEVTWNCHSSLYQGLKPLRTRSRSPLPLTWLAKHQARQTAALENLSTEAPRAGLAVGTPRHLLLSVSCSSSRSHRPQHRRGVQRLLEPREPHGSHGETAQKGGTCPSSHTHKRMPQPGRPQPPAPLALPQCLTDPLRSHFSYHSRSHREA